MQLKFYKEDDRWYADVPGHTQEENEMVCGSDKFLDLIANGKSEVKIHLSLEKCKHLIAFHMISHDDDGAEYESTSSQEELRDHVIWICNVAHDVFEEHPEKFYITFIK